MVIRPPASSESSEGQGISVCLFLCTAGWTEDQRSGVIVGPGWGLESAPCVPALWRGQLEGLWLSESAILSSLSVTVPGTLGRAVFSIEKEVGSSMGSQSWEPEQKPQIAGMSREAPGSPRYLRWGRLGLVDSANILKPH